MKGKFSDERERANKLRESLLYNIGYEHANNICSETDEIINRYDNIKMPENLNNWFYNFNKDFEKKIKQQKYRNRLKHITKKAAIIFIAFTIISFTVAMGVEALRIRFFNMIVETNKHFSFLKLEENYNTDYVKELPMDWKMFNYPTNIPEGYELMRAFDTNGVKYMVFSNSQKDELFFVQGSLTAGIQLDTEQGQVMEVEINGIEGIIIEKDGSNIISWHDNNFSYYIQGKLKPSTLLEVAESIIEEDRK